MQKPKHHIFVCGSFRVAGEAKGACARKDSTALIQYIESEASDRDLDNVLVSSTGCLNLCDHGPVVVVYPEGNWYGGVDEARIDEILDGIESGTPASGQLA
ncbi:MAG: (2Fe-2S) ferredoxin domain-containing protein [Capsulimonadaceae bacterium]|nr:(2Fe-2S) ferredoxin domain-containing protein [Capsulimonadaceae bacterium]